MIKKVRISEKSNGKVIGEFPIDLEIANPTDDDFQQYAWDNAVSQRVADENRKSDYELEIIENTPNE